MSKTKLQITVEVMADETTLQVIHNTLTSNPILAEKLATMLKYTLSSVVLTQDFEIKLQEDHFISHYMEIPTMWNQEFLKAG